MTAMGVWAMMSPLFGAGRSAWNLLEHHLGVRRLLRDQRGAVMAVVGLQGLRMKDVVPMRVLFPGWLA